MPHVILKMVEGRSEDQKRQLAEALAKAVTSSLGCGPELVSIAIEDFKDAEWIEKVYTPYIQQRPATIYMMPGYGPDE